MTRAYCFVTVATPVSTYIAFVHHSTLFLLAIGSAFPVDHLNIQQQPLADNAETNVERLLKPPIADPCKAVPAILKRVQPHLKTRKRLRRLVNSPIHFEIDRADVSPLSNQSLDHLLGHHCLQMFLLNRVCFLSLAVQSWLN